METIIEKLRNCLLIQHEMLLNLHKTYITIPNKSVRIEANHLSSIDITSIFILKKSAPIQISAKYKENIIVLTFIFISLQLLLCILLHYLNDLEKPTLFFCLGSILLDKQ